MEFTSDIKDNIIDNDSDFARMMADDEIKFADTPPPLSDEDRPDPGKQKTSAYQINPDGTKTKLNAEDVDPEETKQQEEKEDIAETLSDLFVQVFDALHNGLMKYISGEAEGSQFEVSEKSKNRIKKSATKVIRTMEEIKQISPLWLLLAIVVIVYLPSTMMAFEVRAVKDRLRKKEQEAEERRRAKEAGETPPPKSKVPDSVTVTTGKPGRPAGTTKENMALRNKLVKR